MKSPLRSSSLFGYRPSDYLGGSRIENIYHLCSNLHVGTRVLFLPGLEMLCHQESLPFWELHDLSSTSSHLFFFIFLQLPMCSAGGRFRLFPQSVQNCREQSEHCVSPTFWCLSTFRGVLEGSVAGEVLALGALNLVWAPKFVQAGDLKCPHALWTASGYSDTEFE